MNMELVKSSSTILLLLCLCPVDSVTLLPYGPSNMNDVTAPGMNDDTSAPITATTPLTFYGSTYTSLWLGSNGYIALQNTVAFDNSIPTPLNLKLIAPMFDDLRPSGSGTLYYRQGSDATDIQRSSELVTSLFPEHSPYTATYVLVVTWSDYVKLGQTGTQTFQAVVTTDGTKTFAVFLYKQLTTGLTADVGIDAGDGTNFYKLCIGGTPEIQSLPLLKQSCDGDPGALGFRIDSVNPDQGTYVCTSTLQDADCAGCGDLSDPDQGTVDTSAGTQIGDIATYSCNDGYDLIGDSNRECLADNGWSGSEPLCQIVVGCEDLPNPDQGTVNTSGGTQVGDIATYSCIGGYELIGDSDRECLADLNWSGSEPLCQIVASYYCTWSDTSDTLVDVVVTVNLTGASGIMALDTQKYEDGADPRLSDSSCETEYTTDPTSLKFTVDPEALSQPSCGVRVTGAMVKTLEVTIRVYTDDVMFDVSSDRVYQFNCTTDTILPKSLMQTNQFNGIEVAALPVASRSLQLLVISPDSGKEVSEAAIGQSVQLRIIYDNTANNVEPYGVFVTECTVADTINFDSTTTSLIEDGCVVEQTPGNTWYMSRSFKQTSLSAAGLFISDSGTFEAVRFSNIDKLFFQCVVDFCFFLDTAPNLCTRSCLTAVRKKRGDDTANRQVLHATLTVRKQQAPGTLEEPTKQYADNLTVYLILSSFGFIILISLILSFILFCKLLHRSSRRTYPRK